jgi:hypothetical protein
LVNESALGFDSNSHDFQMIVGDDGHIGNEAPSTYYFFLELG